MKNRTPKRKAFKIIHLVVLLLVAACVQGPKADAVFRLLPYPQEFTLFGPSELYPSSIKSFHSSSDTPLPHTIPFASNLTRATSASEAQVLFSIDSLLEIGAEGYLLSITKDQITLQANDQAGLLYAFTTLEQLIEDAISQKVSLPQCNIKDAPLLAYRAIHIDVKHHLETMDYYYKLMDRLRQYKINGIILEIEDKLAYPSQPKVGAPEALSVEEWKALSDYALERNIKISPLVQGLGHASFVLKHEEYKPFRDDPESDWAFNPLDPKTYAVQFDLYRDALAAFPHGQYLHVGGDEVHTTGRGSTLSSLELQLNWLKKVCDFAEQQGKTPIFWDDMPLKFAEVYHPMFQPEMKTESIDSIWNANQYKLEAFLDLFPKNCIYMRWNYSSPESYGNNKAMQWFSDHGFSVMGATAGQTRWVLMPQNESNMDNISAFAQSSIVNGLDGLLLTLWDDDSPHFELYQRGIVAFASNTWSGDKLGKEQIKASFRHRTFSPEWSNASYAFIDSLEIPVGKWKNLVLQGNLRNSLSSMPNPLEKGIIELPDLTQPGTWTIQYKDRLLEAEKIAQATNRVLSLLNDSINSSVENHYLLEVYKSVAELTQYTPKLLMGLKELDQAPTLETQTEAFENLFELEKEFDILRNRFEATYAKTRILNKSENYLLDQDHHRHLANQSRNFDWQFNAELLLFEKIKKHPQLVMPDSRQN